jgi:hypothetical protein
VEFKAYVIHGGRSEKALICSWCRRTVGGNLGRLMD